MFDTPSNDGTSRRAVLKAGALGIGASLFGAGATESAAAADDDATRFDDYIEISEPGTYVLTEDLQGGGHIFVHPEVDSIVLDGDGHSVEGGILVGDRSASYYPRDVEIRNFHLTSNITLDKVSGAVVQNNVCGSVQGYLANVRVDHNTLRGNATFEEGGSGDFTFNVFADGGVGIIDSDGPNRVASNYFSNGDIMLVEGGRDEIERVVDNHLGGGRIYVETLSRPEISRNICFGGEESSQPKRDGIVVNGGIRARVESNTVIGHAGNGVVLAVPHANVRNNTSVDNGGDGYRVELGRVDFRRNVAARNGGRGVHFRHNDEANVVQRNVAMENGSEGFLFVRSGDNTVKFNRSALNDADGLAFVESNRNEVRYNWSTLNGSAGLALYDADRNGATRNTLCANGGENLFEDDESENNRYANNTVC